MEVEQLFDFTLKTSLEVFLIFIFSFTFDYLSSFCFITRLVLTKILNNLFKLQNNHNLNLYFAPPMLHLFS